MYRLVLILAFLLLPAAASAQPAWLPGNGWDLEDPYELYVQDGDSAYVYETGNGEYGRAQDGEDWLYRCPGMVEGDAWSLDATMDSLDALPGEVEALVTEGEADGGAYYMKEVLKCVHGMSQHLDTLSATLPEPEKTFQYAEECITNVNNATVHGPNLGLSPGDTVAVYKGDTCAGYNVATGEGVTVAAAGSDDVPITEDGYAQGNTLRVEVYDTSEGSAYRPTVTWASCDTVDVPVCGEGAYQDGSYHEIVSL